MGMYFVPKFVREAVLKIAEEQSPSLNSVVEFTLVKYMGATYAVNTSTKKVRPYDCVVV